MRARRHQHHQARFWILMSISLLWTPFLFDSKVSTTTSAFTSTPFKLRKTGIVGTQSVQIPLQLSSVNENVSGESLDDCFTQENHNTSLWSKRRELVGMTRPSSIIGISLFHMVGTYLALNSDTYWNILLKRPSLWIVFLCEILVSSTSMIINDYHDAKLGRDAYKKVNLKKKVLVSGKVSFPEAKTFVTYLYSVALILVCLLPGAPTRLAITTSLMATFLYTKHLKPKFGIKNAVCAMLVACTPWTSSMAALYTTNTKHAFHTSILACGRLVSCLFFGVVAREIMLDCNDVDCDNKTGIATIPVKYGCGRASAVSLLATLCMSAIAMSQPLYHILKEYTQTSVSMGNVFKSHPIQTRRLGLALTASIIMVRRSWQVFQTRGKNPQVNSTAVDESVLTVVFLLASFI